MRRNVRHSLPVKNFKISGLLGLRDIEFSIGKVPIIIYRFSYNIEGKTEYKQYNENGIF